MNNWKGIFVTGLTAILLVACSGDDADDLCTGPASTTGSPDITASPTFSAGPYTGGDIIIVSVPVDADTQTVVVDFAVDGTITTLDSAGNTDVVAAGGAVGIQTVDVDVTIPVGTVAGTYYPVILLCSGDESTCATTTAYAEDTTGFVSVANYVRGQAVYNSGTGATTFNAVSVSNSCVGISSIVIS